MLINNLKPNKSSRVGSDGILQVKHKQTLFWHYFILLEHKLIHFFTLTISSPGLQLSVRSSRSMASLDRGNLPAGTLPGLSCNVIL